MRWMVHLGIVALVFAGGDVLRPAFLTPPRAAAAANSAAGLNTFPSDQRPAPDQPDTPPRAERLRPESRLALVRYVSGEFARAVQPIPGGKRGFRYKTAEPLDFERLRQLGANNGYAARPGDTVQITKLEFGRSEIVVEVNGGGGKGRRWRDRIQVSIGGAPSTSVQGPSPGFQGIGGTLILDFGKPVPDLTPEELQAILAPLLDFEAEKRSAAVHWIDTLPEEYQVAIKERRAAVGMDREMVIAAMGRPERKVRERDHDGMETEDWIYGNPPGKVVFVRFAGERVIEVREFRQ
jgi:hypothetical protein